MMRKQWVDIIVLLTFFTSDTNPLMDPTMEGAPFVQTPTHSFYNNSFSSKYLSIKNILTNHSLSFLQRKNCSDIFSLLTNWIKAISLAFSLMSVDLSTCIINILLCCTKIITVSCISADISQILLQMVSFDKEICSIFS